MSLPPVPERFSRRVLFLTAVLTHYRLPFHNMVRENLAARNIQYDLLFGQPHPSQAAKGDLVVLPWATEVENRQVNLGANYALWQPVGGTLWRADLVVLGQENRHLINYPLQLLPKKFRPQLAFFGHGRNFQARDPNSKAELWKRWWATKVDWWFAYTDATRDHLKSLGFPDERITVFNNSVDTSTLRLLAAQVTPVDLAMRRAELGLTGNNVCVYVGGLYPDKRLSFLVEALDLIRARVPDFEFVAVGGGIDFPLLKQAASARPWLKVVGPKFGKEKVEIMSIGRLFLIPGLVGLAILDAGILGLPVVTTDYPYHSPEIAYLKEGRNGVITRPWENVGAYADAVVNLLTNGANRLAAMQEESREIAGGFTIEAMAERFSRGVVAALDT